MTTTITWYGHNSWIIETAGKKILLDPFLNDSPTSPVKADGVEADFILLSVPIHFLHVLISLSSFVVLLFDQ